MNVRSMRMPRLGTGIEYLLVLAIAVMAVRLVVGHATRTRGTVIAAAPMFQVGSRLSVPNVLLDGKEMVVLIARHNCVPCQEGAAFYKTLADTVEAQEDVDFVVVSPELRELTREWLDTIGVTPDHIVQVEDLYPTPTLLVVDSRGTIDTVMATTLEVTEEQALLARVSGKRKGLITNLPDVIREDGLLALAQKGELVILDGRGAVSFKKSHRAGAVNIPFRQVPSRLAELGSAEHVVLDCRDEVVGSCPGMGVYLRRLGFRRVSVLFAGQ